METQPSNRILTGCGVSPGYALGKVHVYKDILLRNQEYYVITETEVDEEFTRIQDATEDVKKFLAMSADRIESELDAEHAAIFNAQATMLQDPTLMKELRTELEDKRVNAEQAVKIAFRRLESRFRGMKDSLFRDRGDDIADLCRRILRSLAGGHSHSLEHLPPNTVLVARQLLPSDTVYLSQKSVTAILVEVGGPASHTAILTRAMGIPAVSQLSNVMKRVRQGEKVLVDGSRGEVILDADSETIRRFRALRKKEGLGPKEAKARCRKPAVTRDGKEITVSANIGSREDAILAHENGSDGIGLYRMELIYLTRKTLPSESELLETILDSLAPLKKQTATIRLLDTGAEKELPSLEYPHETNPVLGRRGVRLLLAFPDLLVTQLKTLLRLAMMRPIRILVPMVTVADDMKKIRNLLQETAEELSCDNLPPLGAMLEIPSAVLCAGEIAEYADFFSLGTNDLTQYTMAAGRENPLVAEYFIEGHASVLRLIQHAIETLSGRNPVEICGELAGQPDAIPKLLELGIRHLSVSPLLIPGIKEKIRNCSIIPQDPARL